MKLTSRSLATGLHPGRISIGLLLTLVLSSAAFASQEPAGSVSKEGVWITLGADAFEVLADLEDLRYEPEALDRVARYSGVVLTRVHSDDLPRLSAELHRTHQRCAGFIAHASLEQARREMARLAADRPTEAPTGDYTIDQMLLVQRLEAAIGKPQMLATIDHLSNDFNNRYHANPAGLAAAEWIRDQWSGLAAGRPDVTVELYQHSATSQPSVILTFDGVGLPGEVVVLGAHLDSVSFDGGDSGDPGYLAPGADDDASGIAVLSEVIRVAMVENFRPDRTVQFIGYAAEEVGLVGSGEIAAAYQAAGVNVTAVLQLDMTAYFGSVQDIGVLSEAWTDSALTSFVTDLIDFYQPELTWATTACGYACSDHASWDAQGYPAAMSFESLFGQHNPEIHTTDDTLTTLGDSVDHAYKFARLAAAFMAEVAKEGAGDIFADGFETGTTDAWSVVVP